MSSYWTAAGRDARVKELERRQALGIYGQLPYQQFIIDDIKAPLLEGLWRLSPRLIATAFRNIDKLPEPCLGNTWHPNSHRLIALRDRLYKKFLILRLMHFIRTGMNFLIIVYDYDHPYRDMVDFCIDMLRAGKSPGQIKTEFFKHCHLSRDRMRLLRTAFDLVIAFQWLPPLRFGLRELKTSGWEPRDSHDLIAHDWSIFWREEIKEKAL